VGEPNFVLDDQRLSRKNFGVLSFEDNIYVIIILLLLIPWHRWMI